MFLKLFEFFTVRGIIHNYSIKNSPIAALLCLVYNAITMSTFQINLSESLQQFVEGRVAELGFDRPDQYFEQLLEAERQKRLEEYYYEKCLEGLASGPGTRITDENREAFWNGIKEEIRQRHANRLKKGAVQ